MGFWVWSEMANRRGSSDGRLLISPEKVVNGGCYLGGDLVRRRGNGREKNGVFRWGSFESCTLKFVPSGYISHHPDTLIHHPNTFILIQEESFCAKKVIKSENLIKSHKLLLRFFLLSNSKFQIAPPIQ